MADAREQPHPSVKPVKVVRPVREREHSSHNLLCPCDLCTMVFGPLGSTARGINIINDQYEGPTS